MKRLVLACAAALALGAGSALAQEPRARQSYEEQVVSLADVLGGAHYLRTLCVGRQDQTWRDFMRGVIQREPARSGELSRAFNDGYRREEARFPECSQSARAMEAELRAQGLRLADALSASNRR